MKYCETARAGEKLDFINSEKFTAVQWSIEISSVRKTRCEAFLKTDVIHREVL